ncbi:MAG: reductase [Chitinophagaceae bacterium]|nr:MAG: reductase [Chitinophagaceae bacterium]
MRKLIFQQFISLDGFAADKNNGTGFFADPKWAAGSDKDLLDEMQRFDTILLGASTYKMFVEFWPDADPVTEIVAGTLNSIPKVVFSSTLESAPWGKWEPARIVHTDAVEEIRRLKQQPGKDLVLWGSISLSQAIMEAGLIDEYQFRIMPLFLGEGRPQFGKQQQQPLSLTHSRTYPSGLLVAHYVPAAK